MIAISELVREAAPAEPLDGLSAHLVRLSDQRLSTPVLVTPDYLSLRTRFFVELVRSLSTVTNRPIRIDWYRPVPTVASMVSDSVARWRVSATNRAIAAIATPTDQVGIMQITASISRPGNGFRDLVVGWCGASMPLPPWTTAIELSG